MNNKFQQAKDNAKSKNKPPNLREKRHPHSKEKDQGRRTQQDHRSVSTFQQEMRVWVLREGAAGDNEEGQRSGGESEC